MVQARRGAIRDVSTGIAGFDEVTGGGLPLGRTHHRRSRRRRQREGQDARRYLSARRHVDAR